jgi:transposase
VPITLDNLPDDATALKRIIAAIARGRAGPALLAHIVVSKYDDHLPLYR